MDGRARGELGPLEVIALFERERDDAGAADVLKILEWRFFDDALLGDHHEIFPPGFSFGLRPLRGIADDRAHVLVGGKLQKVLDGPAF